MKLHNVFFLHHLPKIYFDINTYYYFVQSIVEFYLLPMTYLSKSTVFLLHFKGQYSCKSQTEIKTNTVI